MIDKKPECFTRFLDADSYKYECDTCKVLGLCRALAYEKRDEKDAIDYPMDTFVTKTFIFLCGLKEEELLDVGELYGRRGY